MEHAGVFYGIQLGEWDYFFHRLSTEAAESWWRSTYGEEIDQFTHLMKPKGLAGYDRMTAHKQAFYDTLKDHFTSRRLDLLNRAISVTDHSQYETYACEWTTHPIGLEVGESIAFTQSKLAFARGASRQWKKPSSAQVSPWFSGACTTHGPLRLEGKDSQGRDWRGLDAGHSLSFYERMWLHSWFAGAAIVTPENSIAISFESDWNFTALTSHGHKAAEAFKFTPSHERGTPYTPIAIVLDRIGRLQRLHGQTMEHFAANPRRPPVAGSLATSAFSWK